MGCIYKITNKINGKIYIGKTSRTPQIRWSEHKQYSHLIERYNTPLYHAMRKYGIDNFDFTVIEDNISNLEKLNEREKYYIELYNSTSHENGYNIVLGGDGGRTSSKLTIQQVEEIRQILSDIENIQSFSEIGELFSISSSVISSINMGTSWYDSNIDYPIRKYDTTGLTLTRKQYAQIVYEIQCSNKTLKDIRSEFNLSQEQITSINQGYYCYGKDNQYYKGIYNGSFPIRKDSRRFVTKEEFIPVLFEILFTNDSMATIGGRYGIQGNTLQYISNGKRRKELTENFILPLRKNLEENRKIFLMLYPAYGGDA